MVTIKFIENNISLYAEISTNNCYKLILTIINPKKQQNILYFLHKEVRILFDDWDFYSESAKYINSYGFASKTNKLIIEFTNLYLYNEKNNLEYEEIKNIFNRLVEIENLA